MKVSLGPIRSKRKQISTRHHAFPPSASFCGGNADESRIPTSFHLLLRLIPTTALRFGGDRPWSTSDLSSAHLSKIPENGAPGFGGWMARQSHLPAAKN